MKSEENNNTGNGWDELPDNLDAMISGLKSGIKTEKASNQFYHDMEWWLLVAIMRDPQIIPEIIEIIPDPKIFTGFSDDTSHSLIYQALTNLHDDGKEIHFESVYAECEKIRQFNPLITSYSRGAIMELEFRAMVRESFVNLRDRNEIDRQTTNRIRGKFCAEQIVRRK